MKTGVIIPAYNEEDNIEPIIESLQEFTENIIVIDDGSQDSTPEILKNQPVTVLTHQENKGLRGALKTGLKYALENEFEYIIKLDADGQMDVSRISEMKERIQEFSKKAN